MNKKEILSYILIIIAIIIIKQFVVAPVIVNGNSMESTTYNRDVLILNKLDKTYNRFDIVVLKDGKDLLIKRIIALPGESIRYENNQLYINDEIIEDKITTGTISFNTKELNIDKLGEDEYFVLGDNRAYSLDSRIFGAVKRKNILGTTQIRLFPFNKIGKIN
jgi:signal peptidase I